MDRRSQQPTNNQTSRHQKSSNPQISRQDLPTRFPNRGVSNTAGKGRKLRLPFGKKGDGWFEQDHPAQSRNLNKANWFPAPPEPEPPKAPWKFSYKPWMSGFSSLLVLLAIGGSVTGIGWLSIQYLTNPRSVIWVNNYLPQPLRLKIAGWDQPRTMKQIKKELQKVGLDTGEQLRLGGKNSSDFLLPVMQTEADCQDTCTKIVELRIYRPTKHPYEKGNETYFQMVSQLPVAGMDDWFVQEPFVNAQVDVPPPASAVLGFDSIELLEEQAPKDGLWLTMKGSRPQTGIYGQVLYYNPNKATLTAMMPWTSPAGELPRWENVASGGTPELVVDQTIGLEPLYQIHLLEPDRSNSSGLKLRAINLTTPAMQASSYSSAMKLARSGLWSLALTTIESLGKEALAENNMAQLQADVIRYHAKIFKEQAEQASASTSQQVQSNLMDGRWEKAVQVVKAAPEDREDVLDLLNSDTGQLLKRLKVAMEVTPGNSALQAWNAAMKLARSGKGSAVAWLKNQPMNTDRNRFLSDLAPTINPAAKPSPTPSPIASPNPEPIPEPSPVAPPPVAASPSPVPEPSPEPVSPPLPVERESLPVSREVEKAPREAQPSLPINIPTSQQ
jgi:hypothetical protein